ncbi:caspase family protein [Haliangium sp. UPWRP_2]|uniref:caspase family protein n=1 Tax=Haliangium sp. UPWRP_2 TaxID=1931276 RepID=UPI0013048887|nr:caspase family protein [Haliangium sp. UPWRP_2]
MPAPSPAPLHALLIGIDGYESAALNGCVNDIRAVQRFLLEDLGVAAAAITTLLWPNRQAETPDPAPELGELGQEPTLQNMMEALKRLSGPEVAAGDRVLIYYSGHGSFQKVNSAQAYFEGLVPTDYDTQGLLFDLELNRLLQAIADKSGDLSVILDCCNSGGATRDLGRKETDEPEQRSRSLRMTDPAPAAAERRLQPLASDPQALVGQPSRYTVLCACHGDEKATECRRPPRVGRSHGLLTATLLDVLRALVRDRGPEALAAVRFSDVFPTLNARVFADNPAQRPQLLGPPERRIFGGPWKPRDPGYRVLLGSDGGYVIDAGTLAGLSRDAQLAVYGPEPDRFPPLGSPADREARLGALTITSVSVAKANAVPTPPSPAFALPLGARARLVRPGELSRLRVSADSVSAPLRATLSGLEKEHGFLLLPPGEGGGELMIGQYENGDLWLGDDICGPGLPSERSAPGPMARIPRYLLDDPFFCEKGLAGAIRHYAQYVIPIRTYRNGGFSLPPKVLSLRLIDTKNISDKQQLTQQHFMRTESPKNEKGVYQCADGDEIAIEVSNEININLYFYLFLCSMEGNVVELAPETTLQGRSRVLLWYQGIDGQAFPLSLPEGHPWAIDRLLLIATDQPGLDLSMLKQDETMQQMILAAIETKFPRPLARKVEGLRYVALQTLVQIGTAPPAERI